MRKSLRGRLNQGLAVILTLVFALHWLAADFVIRYVAENEMFTRIEHDGDALLASLKRDRDGALQFSAEHVGLIYGQPFSGHYFVIESQGRVLRSPSMGADDLAVAAVAPGGFKRYHSLGPQGQPVLALTWAFTLQGQIVRLTVAEDLTQIGHEISQFRLGYLALTVGVLLLAIVLQSIDVRRALRPLAAVRAELQAVGRGERAHIDAEAPREIQPLVDEVNRLLAVVERRMQQSRNAIGNLAHALKTPLSILFRAAADPELAARYPALAQQLGEQTATLHQRIELELKRARLSGAAQPGAGFNPQAELATLMRLLNAMYEGKGVEIAVSAPDKLLPYDREDMLELVGNLADNACKWAKTQVAIDVECIGEGFTLTVADDGPGCPEEELPHLTQRGLRLDETQPGHGLGLAIVHDIVEFYGGSLSLGRCPRLGGLRVSLRF
ncbi:MAG: ATP-binding protein [Candidatus Methylumidiphilus sp.]